MPGARTNLRLTGALCICAAVAISSTLDALMKWLSGAYPIHELMVVRCLVGFPLFVLYILYEGGLAGFRPPHLSFILLRGLILASANLAFYLAIAAIPIADAVSIYFAMPFFVAALVAPVLGERVLPHRWYAIIAGFLGVLVMIRPGQGVFEPAALLALWSALGYAIGQAMSRPLAGLVPSSVMAFYQNVVYFVVAVVLAAVFARGGFEGALHPSLRFLSIPWTVPQAFDILLMVAFGVFSAAVMPLFVHAYKIAEVNFVAPFEYTAMFWAVMWGAALFGDFPDGFTWLGAAIVIGAGLFMVHMDRVYRARSA